jgi:hypothetical protein
VDERTAEGGGGGGSQTGAGCIALAASARPPCRAAARARAATRWSMMPPWLWCYFHLDLSARNTSSRAARCRSSVTAIANITTDRRRAQNDREKHNVRGDLHHRWALRCNNVRYPDTVPQGCLVPQ